MKFISQLDCTFLIKKKYSRINCEINSMVSEEECKNNLNESEIVNKNKKIKYITAMQYYAYKLQTRKNNLN